MDIGQFWKHKPDQSIWYIMGRAWSYHNGNVYILENIVTGEVQFIPTTPSGLYWGVIGKMKYTEEINNDG